MANEKSDAVKEFEEQMAEEAKFNDIKKEASRNKILLDRQRYAAELERQKQDEQDLEIFKKANFDIQSPDQIEAIQKENREYMDAAKKKLSFIIADEEENHMYAFDKFIPFFRKNLILIGAKTGDGKSTTVANIAYHMMLQKNKTTGEPARTLVITNEERKEDVYNRITCLIKGWSYTNHDKFTDEQIIEFNKFIPHLSKRVTVIDNVHEGAHGVTTSLEGIEGIFENLLANGVKYDCVVIDYYQNIIISKKNPKLVDYEVQAMLARSLDRYKNEYPAPIVLLAQVNAADDDGNPPFYWRIQGRKLIMTVCTFAAEMLVDKIHKVTRWHIWKSRFAESIGETIETGFKDGRFIHYTEEFARSIQANLDRRRSEQINREIGLKNGMVMNTNEREDSNE